MEVNEFCEKYAVLDRHDTNSFKWDTLKERYGDTGLLPMWVADMDFRSPECVIEAIKKRAEHGVFGYSFIPDSYYEAVIDWEYRHHSCMLKKDHIRVLHGVVSALMWSINMYTKPDDAVIILTPIYNQFANAVISNGRKLISCDLDHKDGVFTFNADRFEADIINNNVKMYIMCSPHNPTGRVWTEEELVSMLDICERHDVLVVSDEIHQDLVYGSNKHIPATAAANGKYKDRIITCTAPSKTFNLATLLTSNIIIENDELLAKWRSFESIYFHIEDNVLGLVGAEAALKGGEDWYDGVKKTIYHNYQMFTEAFGKYPEIKISPLEGTYLMFMDLNGMIPAARCRDFIQNKCRIAANYGETYGENFAGYVRLNIATSPKIIEQAISSITSNLELL